MRKRKKRIYAMLLCICMVLSLISAPVSAAETGEAAGSHEHTSECYTWTEQCTHEHTPECYPKDRVSGNEATPSEAKEPAWCTHVCSEESGCITKELNCQYDSESDSTPATVGTSQGNKTNEDAEREMEAATPSNAQKAVTVERVQAMIDVLPSAEEITEDNAEDVKAQLEAIDEAKAQLSDEELDALDFSRYMEAAAALDGLSAPMLTAGGTAEVSTAADLTAALADDTNETVKLTGDVTIDTTLVVNRTVTLDLNGHVLKYENNTNRGSVLMVESGGTLTIADSNTAARHKFTPDGNGLWVLDESGGTEEVAGGVITGGTGKPDDRYGDSGGGVYVGDNASLIMNGGSIVGCRVTKGGSPEGGGVYLSASDAAFTMNDGAHIIGCWSNYYGGGVGAGYGEFIMNGGSIEDCTAGGATSDGNGGGVSISNNSRFIMEAGEIKRCKVTAEYARPVWGSSWGGGVCVSGTFEMKGGRITDCTAKPGAGGVGEGGGVTTSSNGSFIMSGNACIENCTDSTGSGVHNNGWFTIRDSAKVTNNVSNRKGINADGGTIEGEVMNEYRWSKIVGADTGSTEFQGKVTNNGSIEKGTFTGEVINNSSGTIAGGTFTGTVTNNEGTVSGGDFSGATLSGMLVITFNPNNGEPIITQNVNWSKDGAALTLPTPAPIKESHTLEGWYYDNGGTETKWDFDTDKVKYTMTFLAQWKDNSAVEWPVNFQIVEVSDDYEDGYQITNYSAAFNLPIRIPEPWNYVVAPSFDEVMDKAGYTMESGWQFAGYGWTHPYSSGYPMAGSSFLTLGDIRNYTPPAVSTSENIGVVLLMRSGVTIWALVKDVRSPATYTLSYDANGGTGAPVAESITNKNGSADFTISSAIPKREGYTFMGWADSANAAAAVYRANDPIQLHKNGNAEKTIYAVWKPSIYTVTLHANGGAIASGKDITSYTYGAGATLPTENDITREGCTFDGWYADSSFSGAPVTAISSTDTGDMTFYAKWEANTYTVTVQNDGNGTGTATPASATMGEKITLTATPNSGYRFKEWQIVSGSVAISGDTFTMPADNVTVKAIFEKKSSVSSGGGGGGTTYYTLTLETNGGSSMKAINAAYGKTIDLSCYIPTRDCYDFSGWCSDKDLTNKITEIRLNGNKTVYAGWTKHNPNTGANPFTDVSTSDWFYEDVMFVYENGLMAGTSAATFEPYSNTTRTQIAVIFYRLEGSPAVEGKNNFTDVEYGPGTAWYYNAVTWAQQNGIMGGYGDGKFGPNDPVTREQLASIFYRYAQYKGYDVTATGSLDSFTDKGSASAWAQEAIKWAVGNGIMGGKENNLLDSKGTATRAEIAAMLHRFVEKYGLKPVVTPTGTTGWTKPTISGNSITSPKTGESSQFLWQDYLLM